jgi:hypothetical protein
MPTKNSYLIQMVMSFLEILDDSLRTIKHVLCVRMNQNGA